MSRRVLSAMRSPQSSWMLLIMLVWLTVAACNSRAISEPGNVVLPVQTIPIANLQNPSTQNSTTSVKGTVGAIVPILEGTVYELQDPSGKVWVLTRQQVPKTGEEVVVRGKVLYKPILIDGKEQGSIYLEQE